VLAYLANNPGTSLTKMAAALGWLNQEGEPMKRRAQAATDKLKEDRFVVFERGQWKLTEKGQAEAERVGGPIERAPNDQGTAQGTATAKNQGNPIGAGRTVPHHTIGLGTEVRGPTVVPELEGTTWNDGDPFASFHDPSLKLNREQDDYPDLPEFLDRRG
jgi:hypothetical protein